ncbi:MAG: adenylate/guanylate cyclase domain-containing protein, partial [Bacteroidota bacterium]
MGFLTIRTRLMIMLLFVSLLACAVLGYLGSTYGKKVIEKEVTDQLKLVRNAKKSQIEFYLSDIAHFVEVMGQNNMVIEATREFKRAFQKLSTEKLDANCNERLDKHYELFIDKLAANVDVKKDLDLYKPKTLEGCYLQFEYIVDNPNPLGEKDKLLNANDDSEYNEVHQKYHEYFNMLIRKFNFYDVFLVDLETGNIVYTAYKETDFATSLYYGPYRSSNLADLARKLQSNADLEAATWVDFASYRPSYGAPAAFVGVPLTDENGLTVGGLCFQLPVDEINGIMTGYENWEEDGLGESGETYLVGEDFMMRSISRFYLQDTLGYTDALLKLGERQEDIDRMYRFGTTILQQRIRSEGVLEALEGKTDVKIIKDYRGVPVVSAYSPL